MIIFCVNANANISFNGINPIYNFGDTLSINTKVLASSDLSGFLDLNLVCNGNSTLFHKEYIKLSLGTEKTINDEIILTKDIIGEVGECYVSSSYPLNMAQSQKFTISDKIDVTLNISKNEFQAGETVTLEISAIKKNSQKVEGFAEVLIDGIAPLYKENVKDGAAKYSFSLPENIKSGAYSIYVDVYNLGDNGQKLNTGTISIVFNVMQTAKKIDLSLSKNSFEPGEKIEVKPTLYDQASEVIQAKINVQILDNKDNIVYNNDLNSGESADFEIVTNSSFGNWTIVASSNGIVEKRKIEILKLEKLDVRFENNTVNLKNIGNVRYDNPLSIWIDNYPAGAIIPTLISGIDTGEERYFYLHAPTSGVHEVLVNEIANGNDTRTIATDSINFPTGEGKFGVTTGAVIGSSIFSQYPLVWIFIIIILLLSIFVLGRKVLKKKFLYFRRSDKDFKSKKEGHSLSKGGELTIGPLKEVEHSIVMDGYKQTASIIALKIKNYEELIQNKKGNALENLNSIVSKVHSSKGVFYKTNSWIIIVFSAMNTKTFSNEATAIKSALNIANDIREHNRKFVDKIDFGIGVNTGEIIAGISLGKFQFTGLGNTLPLSKRLAEAADNDVLLSNDIRLKVMSEIKTERVNIGGQEYYKVVSVSQRQDHKKFIQGFLHRMEQEEKDKKPKRI
jgi:hypothetical protein